MTHSRSLLDCIALVSFGKVTDLLHFTLQMLYFMLITLLPYCKGLLKAQNAILSVLHLPYIAL